ncbi:MAG: prepilin-type N-terminal cleavage/methylation domain-containing protein [Patescibacteria group bacterium]|nr:prepilin-type N-terminal cleavage/methylation domain-containing protein [Patescibacteria group bacterium]MDD4610993.1 prepilin-type N-terminal cleavage/methylation domain-containing protein [Patescibacteria group bacterium]
MKTFKKKQNGFTLIELLIVIVIIGILAVIIFAVLNPLARFQDSRDAVRREEVYMIANAIKLDQLDHGGYYLDEIKSITDGEVYMINNLAGAGGCDDQNAYCDTPVSSDTNCVNLSSLVSRGYLGELPISKNGAGSWSDLITGYTLEKTATGTVIVRACESENTGEIRTVR